MAPSGSFAIGPVRAARLAFPHLIWAIFFFFLVASLPFVVPVVILEFQQSNAAPASWSGVFATFALHGIAAISIVVGNVATFIIARRMGVKVTPPNSIEKVFD